MMKAGFARLDITPPLGVRLGGYYFERFAEGVIDPLYVNALAFSDGEHTAVALVCDLLGVYNDEFRTWSADIADAAGIPVEAVFLHMTHTHTGPVVLGTREPSDPQYDAWLHRRLCDAAVMAVRDLKPITSIRATENESKGYAFCRRFKMKDGRFQTWGHYIDPDIVAYASKADETFRLVRIAREGGEELALVNFQVHPDTMSGNLVSADYPGVLRELVEAAKPGTKCVFFDGCEGNMGTTDWWHGTDMRLKGKPGAERPGRFLAQSVLEAYDHVQPVEGEGVRFGRVHRMCKTKLDRENLEAQLAEADRLIYIHEHGNEEEELGPDWIATPLVAEAYQLRRMAAADLFEVDMPVSALSVGGLALLGFPGEPFCEIGVHVRENSPYPVTFSCSQTYSCEGYYPTGEAYDQGGYEPRNTRYPKGIGEILMEMGDELLKNI